MDKNISDVVNELTGIFSQIKGVKKVSENLTLTYVVVVSGDDCRENVEKVGSALASQAKKYGFEIDVVTATEEEIQQAKEKAAAFLQQNATFKS